MSEWSKFAGSFHGHPKVEALLDLGARGHVALGLWAVAKSYCTQFHKLRGFISEAKVKRYGFQPSAAQALVDVCLWERAEGGYVFHDWADYAESPEEVDARREKERNKKNKQRGHSKGQDDVSPVVSPGDNQGDTPGESPGQREKKREERESREDARGDTRRDNPPPLLPWLHETNPTDSNLRSLWTEALHIAGIGTHALSANFDDQAEALRALWREAREAVPDITLGRVLDALTGTVDDPGEVRLWAADPNRGKRWRPIEFLSWRAT